MQINRQKNEFLVLLLVTAVQSTSLDDELVWDWGDDLWLGQDADSVSLTGLLVDALDIDKGAGGLGLSNGLVVGDDTVQETLTRLGVLDVLNADIDALGDDATADLELYYKYSIYGRWGKENSILTRLLTMTPTARRVTLKTRPVVPW